MCIDETVVYVHMVHQPSLFNNRNCIQIGDAWISTDSGYSPLLGGITWIRIPSAWVSWKGSMIFGTQNKQKSMSRMGRFNLRFPQTSQVCLLPRYPLSKRNSIPVSFVSTVNNKQKLRPKSQSELLSWCHPNKKRKLPTNGCDSYCISYCGGTRKCTRPLSAPSEHRIILLKSDTSLWPFVDDNDWSSSCFQLDSSWNLWKKSLSVLRF